VQAEKVVVREFLDDILGKLARLVEPARNRIEVLLRKIAGALLDGVVVRLSVGSS